METKLIELLRSATAQVHKQLEALPVSKRIMSPELTTSEYIDYLQRVYTIHHSIEKEVFPIVAEKISNLEQRQKVEYIEDDLRSLHAVVPADTVFFNADFRPNAAFCMGILYVSEGSTLGGQYILKNVQKILGPQAGDAVRFLNVYGPRTGSMWKSFTEILNAYESMLTETEMDEVVAGAVYGFERTRAILDKV